jgi:hypothetical protein
MTRAAGDLEISDTDQDDHSQRFGSWNTVMRAVSATAGVDIDG